MTTPPAPPGPGTVAMSTVTAPRRSDTATRPWASSGGTEYRLPRKDTRAWADTARSTVRVAGNGVAGAGRSGSAAAIVATEDFPSAVARTRVSPRAAHHRSSSLCASSTVTSSGKVRQNRWAATWLAFSTTPLRFPRRGGHGRTATP